MPPQPTMSILVVDDFSSMRRLFINVLNQLGYNNIVEAEDGERALDVIQSQKIDLVITDWNMPRMSGLDLLKAIRSSPPIKTLPVLMVTAQAEQESIIQAAQAGVNNYILKPFDAKTLDAKIKKIFK